MSDVIQRPLEPAEVAKLNAEAAKLNAEAEAARHTARARQYEADEAQMDLDKKRRERALSDASNLEHRVYDFTDSVSRSSAETTIQVLSRWRRLSKDPITIRLSSPGGSVLDGLALFDYIQTLRADGIHVTTATLGMAASMACILLQAGDKRVMGDNAYILIHEVSSGSIGKVSEMEDETKFAKRLNQRLYDILARRSKVKRRTIESRAKRRDWWLDPDEALKLGLCDEVGYR